jgi:hypothetical protein
MSAPYRVPQQNPDLGRAITALRQARVFLDALTDGNRTQAAQALAELVTPGVRHAEDHEGLAVIDQAHATLWSSLEEARQRLARAGYQLGALATVTRTGRDDTTTPARCLAQLQALLPGADFSVRLDEEAADHESRRGCRSVRTRRSTICCRRSGSSCAKPVSLPRCRRRTHPDRGLQGGRTGSPDGYQRRDYESGLAGHATPKGPRAGMSIAYSPGATLKATLPGTTSKSA